MIPDATPENYPQKFVRKSNRGDTLRQNMTSSASSDPELLAAWLDRRHEPAFRMLVARYAGLVRASALRTCENESLAAEAAQLTFITLARKARSLTSCRSLGGWLHQTAVWHARNLLRKARRESRKRDHLQAAMDTDSSHSDAWQNLAPALDDALGSLSAADREALLLRFYRALSISEVAAVLGIAAEAARKRIDRALERLRGKLARRGVAPGVSLGTVMLAGFANDAQAAGGMVPALTTKALAAGAGGAAAVPMSLTAKAACVALPASVMFGGALWLAAQRVSLADLNRQCDALEERLSVVAKGDAASAASRKPGMQKDSNQRIDWMDVAERLRVSGEDSETTGGLMESWRLRIAAMSAGELAVAMDEIASIDLNPDSRQILEFLFIEPLRLKDPRLIFTHFGDRELDDDNWIVGTTALADWAKQDPAAALEWIDRQIAANRFPGGTLRAHSRARYKLEADLIAGLAKDTAEIAANRLRALSGPERLEVLRMAFNRRIAEVPQQELANLARSFLSGSSLNYVLAVPVVNLMVDGYGLDKATAYLQRIQAAPSERDACAAAAAGQFLYTLGNKRALAHGDFDQVQEWLHSTSPDSAGSLMGGVIAGAVGGSDRTMTYQIAADLALRLHGEAGDDNLLVGFLDSRISLENRENALRLAEHIRDEMRRREVLVTLSDYQPPK